MNAQNPGNRGRGRGRGGRAAPAVPPLPPAMMALNPAVQQQMAQQNAFLNMAFGGNIGGMFQAPPPVPFAPQNNLAGQLLQAGLVGAALVVAQAPMMEQVAANQIPEDAPSEDILY